MFGECAWATGFARFGPCGCRSIKNRIEVIASATEQKWTLDVPVVGVTYTFVWIPFCAIYAFSLSFEISYYIVFYRLLKKFLKKWEDVLMPEINLAIKNAGTIQSSYEDAFSKICILDEIWQKVKKKMESSCNIEMNKLWYFTWLKLW